MSLPYFCKTINDWFLFISIYNYGPLCMETSISTSFTKRVVNKYGSVCPCYRSFFYGTLHMWARIDEERNNKEKFLLFKHENMWVCRGQLKTSHTNIGHCELLFLPEWLRHFCVIVCVYVQGRQTTWSRLMKLHINSSSQWPIFVCDVFNCPRQTHMWSFINLDQVVCLHWT
jgi:hypothetical protein